MRILKLLATCLATFAVVACSGTAGAEVRGDEPHVELDFAATPHVPDAALASQALAWAVVQGSGSTNTLTSPSSLAMSLAMAAEGADGVSVDSIDAALGLSGEERAKAYAALKQALSGYDSLPTKVDANDPPETPVVHLAGQVLAIDSAAKKPFLDALSKWYDVGATQATRPAAKKALDAWVAKNTAGLIEKSGIEVTPKVRVVLQDALLFAAAWETPFADTSMQFDLPSGPATVDAVTATFEVRFAAGDRWTAIRLPYDENLAADIVLPIKGRAPEQISDTELRLAGQALDQATPSTYTVTMPSFDLYTSTDLLEALPQVDLSNLNGIIDDGAAGQWVQQVRLQVSALGTVGAAVTEIAVTESAAQGERPVEFIVDRGYVVRVLDTRTDWPLFLGVVNDPTEKPS